jgi:hypothetical protein
MGDEGCHWVVACRTCEIVWPEIITISNVRQIASPTLRYLLEYVADHPPYLLCAIVAHIPRLSIPTGHHSFDCELFRGVTMIVSCLSQLHP